MSHVAGVTIITDVLATESAVEATLGEFGTFARLDGTYGGTKHPQYHVWGAGINYLRIKHFLATIRAQALTWYDSDYLTDMEGVYVLAIIEDEHDGAPTAVWILGKPPVKPWWVFPIDEHDL